MPNKEIIKSNCNASFGFSFTSQRSKTKELFFVNVRRQTNNFYSFLIYKYIKYVNLAVFSYA